jgi:protein-disulfide isomerase
VKTGKVRYVLRNFPLEQLHPNAEKAAEAAECAGDQGKYWEMHSRLFKNQNLLDAKELPAHALVLGLDQDKFKQCVDGGKFTAKVKADQAEGTKLKVTGTPTFFFGYQDEKDPTKVKAMKLLSGAQPLNAFTDIIDNLLNPPKEAAN